MKREIEKNITGSIVFAFAALVFGYMLYVDGVNIFTNAEARNSFLFALNGVSSFHLAIRAYRKNKENSTG